MPVDCGVPVVADACAFLLHRRLRVQRASGIPCALFVFEGGLLRTTRTFRAARILRRARVIGVPNSFVVPANAGTHTPRPIDQGVESVAFAKLQPVVMDPGVRRDDGKARAVGGRPIRSPILTIFWHCDFACFSFRTRLWARPGNEPSTVLAEDCAVSGSGNVVSRRKIWSSEGGGAGRSSLRCSGCVAAHPPDRRASAS
jgi:hypothetical protein